MAIMTGERETKRDNKEREREKCWSIHNNLIFIFIPMDYRHVKSLIRNL